MDRTDPNSVARVFPVSISEAINFIRFFFFSGWLWDEVFVWCEIFLAPRNVISDGSQVLLRFTVNTTGHYWFVDRPQSTESTPGLRRFLFDLEALSWFGFLYILLYFFLIFIIGPCVFSYISVDVMYICCTQPHFFSNASMVNMCLYICVCFCSDPSSSLFIFSSLADWLAVWQTPMGLFFLGDTCVIRIWKIYTVRGGMTGSPLSSGSWAWSCGKKQLSNVKPSWICILPYC